MNRYVRMKFIGKYLLIWFISVPVFAQLSVPDSEENNVRLRLEKVEKEQTYLKYLHNLRTAVEKELAIVKLIRECDNFDATCTGQGLSFKPPESVLPAVEESVPEDPVPEDSVPEAVVPPPTYDELPVFLWVYRDTAVARYQGSRIEVHVGADIGPYTVKQIQLNYVELTGAQGTVRLPLQW